MLRNFNQRTEEQKIKWFFCTNKPRVLQELMTLSGDYLGEMETIDAYSKNAHFIRRYENSVWRVIVEDKVRGRVARVDLVQIRITPETEGYLREYMGEYDFNRVKDKYPRDFIEYICTSYGKMLPLNAIGYELKRLYLFWYTKTKGKFQNYFPFKRGRAPFADKTGMLKGDVKFIGLELPKADPGGEVCKIRYQQYIWAKEFNLLPEHPRQGRVMYNRASVPHALETYTTAIDPKHHTQAKLIKGEEFWIEHRNDDFIYCVLPTVNFLGTSIGVRLPNFTTDVMIKSMMTTLNDDVKTLDKLIRYKNGQPLAVFSPQAMLGNWFGYYPRYQSVDNKLLVTGYEKPPAFSALFSLELSNITVITLEYEKGLK